MSRLRTWAADRVRGREGFVLIEALAALTLGGLLLVALVTLTGMLRRSADIAAFRVETMEVSGRTLTTIATELRQATRRRWAADPAAVAASARAKSDAEQAPRSPQANQSQQGRQGNSSAQQPDEVQNATETQELDPAQRNRQFVFSGTPDRLIFALSPLQANGLRADVLVIWQIDPSGAALRAEGELTAAALGAADVKLGPVARVAPGPERLRFAYIGPVEGGGEVITDAWTETARMPAAVRIDRLDPKSLAVVGSVRVPIELNGEPGCADPSKAFCSHEGGTKTGTDKTGTDAATTGPPDDGSNTQNRQ